MPVRIQNFLGIIENAHHVDFTHVNTVTIYHTFELKLYTNLSGNA